ncbi:PAS domain-containing protein [Methylobacterium fujisawaense]|uniref:PAS domain-containing protein n=1 Tax=Methylobacterium fujisawaense TaxID=107400 RepID=UPI003CF32F2F
MTPSLKSALAASGYVGVWETNLATQTVAMTGALPNLLGVDEQRAAAGVPVSAFLEGVHPDDRERVAYLIQEAHRTAGRFEADFQTNDGPGGVRRVAARGRVEVDADGRGHRCLGVVLDLGDGGLADLTVSAQRLRAIDRVVDALIAVRPLLADAGSPILRTLIDATLLEFGRLLASQMEQADRQIN